MSEITSDLLQSIKEINIMCLKSAISKGETFLPKAHLLGENQNYVIMMPFKDDEERLKMLSEIGLFAYEKKAYQIIFISDVVFKRYTNEKDFLEVLKNQDTERPSLYPENLRSQGILVYALNFKDIKKEKTIILPYTVENKIVTMLEEINYTLESNLNHGFIKGALAESFTKAKLVDILKRKEIHPAFFQKMKPEETTELLTEMEKELNEEYPNILTSIFQKR